MKNLVLSFVILISSVTFSQEYFNAPQPENVLVVYRNPSQDQNDPYYDKDYLSEQIKDDYILKRSIPSENVFGLDIPFEWDDNSGNHLIKVSNENEIIHDIDGNYHNSTGHDYLFYPQSMEYVKKFITQPIETYLCTTMIAGGDTLKNRIRFIVVCKGVPLKVTTWDVNWSHIESYALKRMGVSVDGLISIINQSDESFSITNQSFVMSPITDGYYSNPYHGLENNNGAEYVSNYRFKTKTFTNNIELNYLVSRLDGYNFVDISDMITS